MSRHLSLAALMLAGLTAQARGADDLRIERLICQLGSDRMDEREQASKTLEDIGERAVPALVNAMMDNDSQVRCRAITSLGRIRRRSELAVPALLDALKDHDDSVKESAILALSDFGSSLEAQKAIRQLLALAQKGSHRTLAMYSLRHMRHNNEKIVAFFVGMVKEEKDRELRSRAVDYVGEMGERAKSVSPLLMEKLESAVLEDMAIADTLAVALGKFGPGNERLVKALTKLCVNEKASTNAHRQALIVLADIGPSARSAIPMLIRRINRSSEFEFEIGRVFRSIGADAVSPLVDNLKKSEGEARLRTIRMLNWIGPPAKDALPLLRELAKKRICPEGRFAEYAIRVIDRPTWEDPRRPAERSR